MTTSSSARDSGEEWKSLSTPASDSVLLSSLIRITPATSQACLDALAPRPRGRPAGEEPKVTWAPPGAQLLATHGGQCGWTLPWPVSLRNPWSALSGPAAPVRPPRRWAVASLSPSPPCRWGVGEGLPRRGVGPGSGLRQGPTCSAAEAAAGVTGQPGTILSREGLEEGPGRGTGGRPGGPEPEPWRPGEGQGRWALTLSLTACSSVSLSSG